MAKDLTVADLFAGGGGTSTGVAMASVELNKSLDLLAVNHWDLAIKTHMKNHPWARHLCTGLDAVLPQVEIPGGRLNLLAASPECTHHSAARGGKPMSDQSRSSAWLILKWLQELYVEGVMIENVQEFQDWGPLGANGRPMEKMKGQLFQQFISSLKALGYNVEYRVVNSANYGAATARERLFILARRGKNKRIVWPDETHVKSVDQVGLFEQKAKWRAAREIIDWSYPSQSIFSRERPLAATTIQRIMAGLKKFGGKNAEPFLMVLRNHMGARSMNDPMPTITAGGTHIGLVEPKPFVLSMEHGNKAFMVPLNHGDTCGGTKRVYDIDNPMPTITTVDAWGVVQPFYFNMQRAQDPIYNTDRPMPTITASSSDYGLCEPFIVPFFGEAKGQAPRCHSLDDSLPTVTSHGAGGLVEPFIITAGGPEGQGRNPKDINNPLPTVLTDDRHALIEPFIISYYGTMNVSSVDQPLPTATAKARFALVQVAPGVYLDIHFRMLQWHELSAAMGFPAGYEFCGSRSDKVKQIGNAVEVKTARALAMSALAA